MKPMALRILILLLASAAAVPAMAQHGWGRVSIFAMAQSSKYDDGTKRDFSEITLALALRSPQSDEDGVEYGIDMRGAAYPSSEERDGRASIYDAWAGARTAGGRLSLRAGQMWLQDLGGVGSIGGVAAEYRHPLAAPGTRIRFGLFGGAEPKNFDVGYVTDVKKGGAWLSYDGNRSRRHSLGYVLVRDSNLTERSVITTMNYIPAGKKAYFYQAAEYDLSGPGGQGKGGLNYLFANGRYTPVPRLELLATYHHGRAIDARGITQDILNGRPVDQRALDGYLFESAGGRVTVEAMRNLRLFAGYARDRNNSSDQSRPRITAGFWAANIGGSGFDATLSDNRIERDNGKYNAWYASLGRTFGRRLYASVDYSTSLSVVRFIDGSGTTVETHPRTKRYGLNGIWNATRFVSLIFNAEQLKDDSSTDDRGLVGITWRF